MVGYLYSKQSVAMAIRPQWSKRGERYAVEQAIVWLT